MLPQDQTSILRLKKRDGLVRDLNPGPLAPKARIIPLDQRATTSFSLPPPVLLQVTPVKLAAIAQMSACAPENPALGDRRVAGSQPQSGFRATFRLSAPRAAGTGGRHSPHPHPPIQLQLCSVLPQIEAGDFPPRTPRPQEASLRDRRVPGPEAKQTLELLNNPISLYLIDT